MNIKSFAALVVLGFVVVGLSACGGSGGANASAEMVAAIPDGDYDGVVSMRINAFKESGFIKNLKEAFPMAGMLFQGMDSSTAESGLDAEDVDVMLACFSTESWVSVAKGDLSEEKIKTSMESYGLELEEKEAEGVKFFVDSDLDKGFVFANNVGIMGTEEVLTEVMKVIAGSGKKFADSETYKLAADYLDTGATFSFYIANRSADMDVGQMTSAMSQYEDDPEKVAALAERVGKLEAVGGKVNVTDAIEGKISMIFPEADDAKFVADYYEGKKKEFFEKAADQMEEMGQMMPINVDKGKIIALADKFKFNSSGNAMNFEINLAWGDVAFFFEE